jgi:hypothetical protein
VSVLSDIVAAGLSVARQLAGETVLYIRGAHSLELTEAKPRGGKRPEERERGIVLQVEELEWLILASELILNGTATKPARNDRIEWTKGATKYTYTVLPTEADQVWRWADRGQSHFHVYAKLTKTEAA